MKESSSPKIIALIAAWNEAPRIAPVVAAAVRHLPVQVVDDGSTDETAKAAEAAGANVIRHDTNRGKGVALLTGFEAVLLSDTAAVVTLDADGQHDPDELPIFLDAFESRPADLIIGKRDFKKMPIPRRWTNPFGSWLLSRAVGADVYDSQSGYRLHSRALLEGIDLQTTGFELETEIIVQAVVRSFKLDWVPIRTIYGVGETSYYHPVHDSAQFFRMVRYARRQRALSLEQ